MLDQATSLLDNDFRHFPESIVNEYDMYTSPIVYEATIRLENVSMSDHMV